MATIGFSGGMYLQSSESHTARFLRDRLADATSRALPAPEKPDPAAWSDRKITAAWVGHSTVLLNIYGFTVLTDPVLFARVGPEIGITIGPKRRVAAALKARELPHIDLVLLSHAHLDHMDMASLHCFPGTTQAITASSTADIIQSTRLSRIRELGWGDRATISSPSHGDLTVEAFEVKHWGARWRHDTFRGYNGYILERNGKKIIFGGDTAYTSSFSRLKGKGPFALACMPIGAYNPFINSHCNPEQAVQMANEAGAEYILPMHHFTFRLGRETPTEPLERFESALASEPERIALRHAGETFGI